MAEKKGSKFAYIVLFITSFLFFLYLTFPYGILKEALVSEISRNTGLTVKIDDFGPNLPIGFVAEGVTISKGEEAQAINLRKIEVSLVIFRIFMWQLGVDAEIISRNKGTLDLSARWGMNQLIAYNNFIPLGIEMEAHDFDFGQVAGFGLKTYAKSANNLIKGTLSKMMIAGSLDGQVEADLVVDDPVQSSGRVDLKLLKASLDMNDPNLSLSKQIFTKAAVQANLQGGRLNISKTSGFHSQELMIDINGYAQLKNPPPNSLLNIGVDLKIVGNLKENFDFVLSMMGGKNGEAKYKLSGSIGRPNFRSL